MSEEADVTVDFWTGTAKNICTSSEREKIERETEKGEGRT